MANPIYIEYYSHERSNCYKVKNPWTRYASETIVLCKVSDGIDKAKELCIKVLNEKMLEAFKESVGGDE